MENVAQQIRLHLQGELGKVMFGLESYIDILSIGVIAGGHLLINGSPGSGKTLLGKSLLQLLDQSTARIDCGNDIEFTNILHSLTGSVGTQSVTSDITLFYLVGLNRLSPNTQAILLPVMEERQLINNEQVITLGQEFRVIATNDPCCYDDTYPLLTALADRFYVSLLLDNLSPEQEIILLKAHDYPPTGLGVNSAPRLAPISPDLVLQARNEARTVTISDSIYRYVIQIVSALRHHPDTKSSISARATLSIINAAKIHACLSARDYVSPDDIRAVTVHCLSHRLRLTTDALINDRHVPDIIQQIITATEISSNATD